LIVDDETLIAHSICDLIARAFPQASATPAGSVQDALDCLAAAEFDAAVLDANLNGESARPVAEALARKRVPYFVITGNLEPWRLPPPLNTATVLAKPFRERQMIEGLRRLAEAAKQDSERDG
jgi:DNA-binding NtrC family response regulator